jgi:hypothetical protein
MMESSKILGSIEDFFQNRDLGIYGMIAAIGSRDINNSDYDLISFPARGVNCNVYLKDNVHLIKELDDFLKQECGVSIVSFPKKCYQIEVEILGRWKPGKDKLLLHNITTCDKSSFGSYVLGREDYGKKIIDEAIVHHGNLEQLYYLPENYDFDGIITPMFIQDFNVLNAQFDINHLRRKIGDLKNYVDKNNGKEKSNIKFSDNWSRNECMRQFCNLIDLAYNESYHEKARLQRGY